MTGRITSERYSATNEWGVPWERLYRLKCEQYDDLYSSAEDLARSIVRLARAKPNSTGRWHAMKKLVAQTVSLFGILQ